MYAKLLNIFQNHVVNPWLGILSDKLYGFSPNSPDTQLKSITQSAKVRFILLSREHYQETQKDYPVESKKELTKIINLELSADPNKKLLYRVGAYVNKKRTVTFAHLNKSVFEHTAKLNWFICIPQSWFIGDVYNAQLIKVNGSHFSYWLYSNKEKTQSYQCKGVFSQASSFCAAVGISNELTELSIAEQDVSSLFRKKSFNFIFEHFQGLIINKPTERKLDLKMFMPGTIICLLTVFLYNITTSLYLENEVVNLQKQQKVLMKEAGTLFALQKDIQGKSEKIAEINNVLFSPSASLNVWRNLLPLYQDQDLQFKNITVLANGTVQVMAEAPKATKILGLISSQANTENAHFYTDVAQINNKERFTISYKITPAPMLETKNNE